MALKNLIVKIGVSTKGLNSSLRKTKSDFRRNFGEIAGMAKNVAAVIGTSLVGGMALLIKKGAEMETLRTGFISIAGGANKAAAIVKELNEFTAKTPYQLEEVSSAARQLLAVGTKRSELQKELKMVGDIAAISSGSISEIASVYAKVQAKGKVELENLNQLAERGIKIFDELKVVTGDANMEFGAGAVSVEDFNTALANMTKEGGIAAGAMENLSQTVEGRMTTLMDNLGMELGKAAEKTGLSRKFGALLEGATESLQGLSGVAESDVAAALGMAEEAMEGFGSVTTDNLDEVEQQMADAKAAMQELVTAASPGLSNADMAMMAITGVFGLGALGPGKEDIEAQAEAIKPLLEMMAELDKAALQLNQTVMAGGVAAGTGGEDGAGDGDEAARKKAFIERFNAAAALREEQERINELTFQHIDFAREEAEALAGVTDAMYGMQGGMEILIDEEEELFDESFLGSIEMGTRLIRNAGLAAANAGALMGTMGGLVGAAFDNIKDSSEGFHMYIKSMLEDLLKRATALVATFAAMSLFTGGSAKALTALGAKSFKGFFMGGMGLAGFAEGGIVTGPTLGLIGEGPGTTMSNPEVIAPLDKLRSMMGGNQVQVTGMLRGADILLTNERAQIDRNRLRSF
jgi:hypothetical protein